MPTDFYAHLRQKGTDWLLCWPVPVGDGRSSPVAVRRRDLHHIPDWNLVSDGMCAGTRQEKRVWADGVERTETVIETLPFQAEEL